MQVNQWIDWWRRELARIFKDAGNARRALKKETRVGKGKADSRSTRTALRVVSRGPRYHKNP